MDFLSHQVQVKYTRWLDQVGTDDPYNSDQTVGLQEILRVHFLIADYFYNEGEGIGGIGPKDINLLHSARYRQFVSFDGIKKWSDPFDICATLFFGIVKDHPLHDANKRTAFLVSLYHMHKIGRCPAAPQKRFEDFAIAVAESRLAKYRRYKAFTEKQEEPEIRYIADFFNRNTRAVDNRYYTITFNQLNTILHKFRFGLENLRGNHIDVVRYETRRAKLGMLRIGKRETVPVRVAKIGFPGWKSQVGKGAINTVRKETGLIAKRGYDSQTFYQGADPIPALISQYHGPLRRLADR